MKPNEEWFLDFDGQTFFLDGSHFIHYEVKRAPQSRERPQGLKYSCALIHVRLGRLAAIDNAHSHFGPRIITYDHLHRGNARVKPYRFKDVATLLEDFYQLIEETRGSK
ncbi:MAG: hypothetical protein A2600_00385 [Candidatus Lambdaproteobacteria bacterium RIFOXYD1_FULL_56_27]|uniref:Uncharacterized protein n=1 Tax=Candidatus Lambdaproteobacteria bacterium RIFOXYD2_FULL_56_26 TaxID=1817773 RepID=A0A1F6GR17_9PROT|nr:MAG: hypothetical protein A2557_12165 [Candidatus Lambdaproteobacteria bacterium RIFOXYD2_FULL_56_26]OGH05281.1 MAG: hypothetical protein A2426_07665 [Candidatus Lambdaproteobacteria bacterium RIFOXYC1_FULL_56_13]OGH09990.1 MAG: hypothetical protein A2600_00385 [Candidatus Lambdaproteobacteria bacterium RIFOXYD1_FULL_56_27]